MFLVSRKSLPLVVLLSAWCLASANPILLYNDPGFLDAEIRRVRAGKAGLPVTPPVLRLSDSDEVVESGDGENGDDEDYEYSSEELDVTCAPGKGWHQRGQRCVPINCPGGPDHRDFNTGECLHGLVVQPMGRYKPYSQWNSLNHVYHTHPAQRFLSRGMVSLLRRG